MAAQLHEMPDEPIGYVEYLDIEGTPTWRCWYCNWDAEQGPCPRHAPLEFPGLDRRQCLRDPSHVLFTYAIEGGIEDAPCWYCLMIDQGVENDGLRHAAHGRWRRWRVVWWLAALAEWAGLVGGHGAAEGRFCGQCLTVQPRPVGSPGAHRWGLRWPRRWGRRAHRWGRSKAGA